MFNAASVNAVLRMTLDFRVGTFKVTEFFLSANKKKKLAE